MLDKRHWRGGQQTLLSHCLRVLIISIPPKPQKWLMPHKKSICLTKRSIDFFFSSLKSSIYSKLMLMLVHRHRRKRISGFYQSWKIDFYDSTVESTFTFGKYNENINYVLLCTLWELCRIELKSRYIFWYF